MSAFSRPLGTRSGVTIAHLAMREDATLFVKSADVGEKEK